MAPSDLLALALGLAAATADVASGHTNFSLNNLLACCIATDLLQLIGLRSFRVAAVLLCGLLAYDVFWVFASPAVVGDNVMLTVATSQIIAGPTRLLFPRFAGGTGEASDFPFSLLGAVLSVRLHNKDQTALQPGDQPNARMTAGLIRPRGFGGLRLPSVVL